MKDSLAFFLVNNFLKKNKVIALGTSSASEKILKQLALNAELEGRKIKLVPSSFELASIASSLGIEIVKPSNGIEIAIEFASIADNNFNFIKNDTHSLIRDKIIARIANELIIVVERKNLVERLQGIIPFEISKFAADLTVAELECFGKAKLRKTNGKPFLTESGHYIADVEINKIHSIQEIDLQARMIPGVLESGLFFGYADKMILIEGKKIEVKEKKGKTVKILK
jgi:ribose 5-phosphate isomerase A